MRQAQSVEYERYPSRDGLAAFDEFLQGGRRELPDDLSLCFVCLQWACKNPDCRSGLRCDLQAKLDQLESPA